MGFWCLLEVRGGLKSGDGQTKGVVGGRFAPKRVEVGTLGQCLSGVEFRGVAGAWSWWTGNYREVVMQMLSLSYLNCWWITCQPPVFEFASPPSVIFWCFCR